MHAIVVSHDSIKIGAACNLKIRDDYTNKLIDGEFAVPFVEEVELDAAQGLCIRRIVVRIPLLQNTVRCGEC